MQESWDIGAESKGLSLLFHVLHAYNLGTELTAITLMRHHLQCTIFD